LSHTVIETTACTNCASGKVNTGSGNGGITASATAVTGNLSVLNTKPYTGVSGTTTLCIYKNLAYATPPTSGNLANMPCIANAKVHFAKEVTGYNAKVNAYLGMALGKGADRQGSTPTSTDLIMN